MKNNAIISIKSMREDDKDDVIELLCNGSIYEKNGNWYIFYDEKEEMGMANCSVKIKIEPDKVIVTRKGDFYSKMVYKEGSNYEFLYNTPYGAMTMVIKTKKTIWELNDKGGELRLEYSIDFQNDYTKNIMTVSVKKTEE